MYDIIGFNEKGLITFDAYQGSFKSLDRKAKIRIHCMQQNMF